MTANKRKQYVLVRVLEKSNALQVSVLEFHTITQKKNAARINFPLGVSTDMIYQTVIDSVVSKPGVELIGVNFYLEGRGAAKFMANNQSTMNLSLRPFDHKVRNKLVGWINAGWVTVEDAAMFHLNPTSVRRIKVNTEFVYDLHVDSSAPSRTQDGRDHYSYGMVCGIKGTDTVLVMGENHDMPPHWESGQFEMEGLILAVGKMYNHFRSNTNHGATMKIRLFCDNKDAVMNMRRLARMYHGHRADHVNTLLGTGYTKENVLAAFFSDDVTFETIEWEKGHDGNVFNDAADRVARETRRYAEDELSGEEYSQVLQGAEAQVRAWYGQNNPEFLAVDPTLRGTAQIEEMFGMYRRPKDEMFVRSGMHTVNHQMAVTATRKAG